MAASIRLARAEDGAAIAAIYAPFVRDTAVSFELEPPSAAEMTKRIEKALVIAPFLANEESGEVIGYAYGGRWRERAAYQWSVEVSVYVDARHPGRGIGTALYRVLLELLRLQGFRIALGGVTLPNPGSVALHEKLGFEPVATYRAVGYKFGAWHDVGWWQLDMGVPQSHPRPPLSPAEAARDPRWNAALRSAT